MANDFALYVIRIIDKTAAFMQIGRQEFNQRKGRKGAFWEDRYHATAVERNEHLIRCLVYIDLNMVRAGVVSHPSEWELCGFNEIQSPPERYGVIDLPGLTQLCGFTDPEQFVAQHRQWVQDAIAEGITQRESCWTESVAVGSLNYVAQAKATLGVKGAWRRVVAQGVDSYVLREAAEAYHAVVAVEVFSPVREDYLPAVRR